MSLGPRGRRWIRFSGVGFAGLIVQLVSLWVFTRRLGVHYLVGTVAATELAILHNFRCHVRWTWADRPASRAESFRRLLRFHLANGAISMSGNFGLMAALVELAKMPYLLANLLSVAACSLANFLIGDLVVFAVNRVEGVAADGAGVPIRARRCTVAAKTVVGCAAVWVAAGEGLSAAELNPRTLAAFERCTHITEARIDQKISGHAPFLGVDELPGRQRAEVHARLRNGEVVVTRMETEDAGKSIDVPGGICHHWSGIVFAAGVSLERTISVMQDYDRYPDVYRPAVRRAKTMSHTGDRFTVSMQLFVKKIVSVILNVDYDIRYVRVATTRMHVRSYSTRIAEVRDADTPDEWEKPVGQDNGFLWRFNNYWSLEERDGGTYIQCESLSLSRDIPPGLGWIVRPFATSVPRESLEFTLAATRAALTKTR